MYTECENDKFMAIWLFDLAVGVLVDWLIVVVVIVAAAAVAWIDVAIAKILAVVVGVLAVVDVQKCVKLAVYQVADHYLQLVHGFAFPGVSHSVQPIFLDRTS